MLSPMRTVSTTVVARLETNVFTFDRDIFFRDLRGRTGLVPKPPAKTGLQFLLNEFERDPGFTQIRDLAYVLATIRWETAETFEPVKEKRARRDTKPKLWERQNRYWGSGFCGRGYVQITWRKNYRKAGERLAGTVFVLASKPLTVQVETLVNQPDLVLEPLIAYAIAARGMREGWFTDKKLSDFIRNGQPPDYLNARKTINGLDQAERIAEYANVFELVLRAARGSN
jgi:putative chitinase